MTDKITNKEIIQKLYKEVLANWNMALTDELIAPQFTSHDWPDNSPGGPKAFRDYYSGVIKSVVPDGHYEADDIIAEGDKVVVRWRLLGTHLGQYRHIAPTGKAITLKGIAIYRLEGNKVAERWVVTDLYGLMAEIQRESSKAE